MNLTISIEFIAIFIFSNLASELIKYLGVKVFTKIDAMNKTWLD